MGRVGRNTRHWGHDSKASQARAIHAGAREADPRKGCRQQACTSGVHGLWDVRGQMLENKLDDVQSGSGASSSTAKDNGVNESDYLNDLEKSLSRNVGDIKKARQLFTLCPPK